MCSDGGRQISALFFHPLEGQVREGGEKNGGNKHDRGRGYCYDF
jgi:hypothetical protein